MVSVLLLSIAVFLIWMDWRFWWLLPLAAAALALAKTDSALEKYEITDRRVVRYNPHGPGKQALLWSEIGSIRLVENPDGTGTVIFEPQFNSLKPRIKLHCVAHAPDVQKLGIRAKQSMKTTMR